MHKAQSILKEKKWKIQETRAPNRPFPWSSGVPGRWQNLGWGGRQLQERDQEWQGPQGTRLQQMMARDLRRVAWGRRQSLHLRAFKRKSSPEGGPRPWSRSGRKATLKEGAAPAKEFALPHCPAKGSPLSQEGCLELSQIQVISRALTLGISWYCFHLVRMRVVSAARPKTLPSSMCLHKNNLRSRAKP